MNSSIKFIFLYLLLFFLATVRLIGQKEKFRFGIATGVNLAYLEYLDAETNDVVKTIRTGKPGIFISFYSVVRLNPVLNVQANISYTQKGLRYKQDGLKIGQNTMNYAELPISGHLSSFNKRKQFWDIFAGAYVGYWTDGKYIVKYTQTGLKTKESIDFNNEDYAFNRTDIGFLIGGSFLFSKNLSCELKYSHGFASLARKAADPTAHRVFSLGFNYIAARKGKL